MPICFDCRFFVAEPPPLRLAGEKVPPFFRTLGLGTEPGLGGEVVSLDVRRLDGRRTGWSMSSTKGGSTGFDARSAKSPLVVGLGVSSSFRRLFDRWRDPIEMRGATMIIHSGRHASRHSIRSVLDEIYHRHTTRRRNLLPILRPELRAASELRQERVSGRTRSSHVPREGRGWGLPDDRFARVPSLP